MSDFTAENEPQDLKFLHWRVGALAKDMIDILKWRGDVDLERQRLRNEARSLAVEMADLKQSVESLRKVILGFAFTVAGSAVVFAFTVLVATGKVGG